MRNIFKIFGCLAAAACALLPSEACAQAVLVKNGKPTGKIVVATDTKADKQAADLLQDFVKRMSGAQIPVVQSKVKNVKKGDVVIATANVPGVEEDGCRISTTGGYLRIDGGAGKGSLYGVVTLLEQYLGCSYWADHEFTVPNLTTVALPRIDKVDNPSFRYRQTNNYSLANDSIYRIWYRLEEPDEAFAGNYWVHTENRLVPAEKYGSTHPEYYAYYNGARHPGAQLCLTNPEVLDVVTAQLDSIFKANPGKNIISVSQNDGNGTNCTCDNCRKLDEYEGSLSGSVIYFMNKLAERFPDKEISTLAYLFTVNPPKHVKPLPNVNIMLCDIDCMRELPLEENATGKSFVAALEGWSAISNNIFLWDYGINFDGFLTPFPNFHVIKPNIELFKKNHVNMHFSQIAGSWGGDFSELRTYMVSKLMWNHTADSDSLMTTFLNGYYGKASPFLYRYLQLQQGALLGSGKSLWIYDTPVTHKDGMLSPALMRRYNQLFDEAESAVADDADLLKRVRRARLSLQYSELELARASQDKNLDEVRAKLDLFEQRCADYKVLALNERNNSPLEYCQLYRQRYLPNGVVNKAAGAKFSYSPEIPERYRPLGEKGLADGLYGGATYGDSWLGWEGCDATITIDMGEVKKVSSIGADFLHQLGAWILLPKQVNYSVSTDGRSYTGFGSIDIPESREGQVRFVSVEKMVDAPVEARYIKIDVVGTKDCPQWHYGVGNPCWFFLDEVVVQ